MGVPICLDEATSKRAFGHFARVLIDLDLKSKLRDKILVEREDFAFFAFVDYERLPEFCSSCQTIGHSLVNCLRSKGKPNSHNQDNGPVKLRNEYVPKSKLVDLNKSTDNNVHANDKVADNKDRDNDLIVNTDLAQTTPQEDPER